MNLTVEQISGIGDDAFWNNFIIQLVKGDIYVNIKVGGSINEVDNNINKEKTIIVAKTVAARLP